MRKPLVAGNWKMNLNLREARELVAGIRRGRDRCADVDLAICPPFVYLFPMQKALDGSNIRLGAQDVFYEANGPYTGEISADMLAEAGVSLVIIGHSERRRTILNPEDDWTVHRKLLVSLAKGLDPILCVGETLAQRHAGQTLEVLTFQLSAALVGVDPGLAPRLAVAYEPVWAIGTGQVATPEQAREAHAHIRAELRRWAGPAAEQVRILYGGSLKPDNAAAIFRQPDVDGGLVGGASLNAEAFLEIARAALAAGHGGTYTRPGGPG